MKSILMVLTNHGVIEGTDTPTGWYLPEMAHPFFKFKGAGFHIDVCSVAGGDTTCTPASIDLSDEQNKQFWETPELRALTQDTAPLSSFEAAKYACVFFVGGFGTMWDFPHSADVQRMGREVYEQGGVVGAVCHGPIALAYTTLSDGSYLVAGKDVAGFTNEEEAMAGLLALLPTHQVEGQEGALQTCGDVLAARGGVYSKTEPWGAHVAGGGSGSRLVTGQNPASAGAVGEAIVAALLLL